MFPEKQDEKQDEKQEEIQGEKQEEIQDEKQEEIQEEIQEKPITDANKFKEWIDKKETDINN